jgi:HEPN domain-containing protein
MKKLTLEWIQKAEGDYHSALREYRARKYPNYDSAGFHAQQSIEKYLKAILQENNIRFHKVHDLLALMQLCLSVDNELESHKDLLSELNPFAVVFRYPGESATKEEAKDAIKALKTLRIYLRTLLGLETESR